MIPVLLRAFGKFEMLFMNKPRFIKLMSHGFFTKTTQKMSRMLAVLIWRSSATAAETLRSYSTKKKVFKAHPLQFT